MKKVLLILSILLPVLAFSQLKLSDDFSVSTGTPYKVVDAPSKQYFSDGKGNSISIKTAGTKVTIQQYDVTNMKEISRHEYIDLPADSRVQKIIRMGEHLYYFYNTPTKSKTMTLNVREINLTDGTFKAPKLLFESKGEVSSIITSGSEGYVSIFGGGVFYDFIESSDHSKLLVRYRRKPLDRNDVINYDILGFYSFDDEMKKIWGGEYKMPYTEKVMNNLSYTITKDGTGYMMAYINDTKQFELLILDGTAIKTVRLDIESSLFFQSIIISEDLEGNLLCTGYYANGIEFKVNWTGNLAAVININGILRFKLNKAGKILELKRYDFPIELINQYESLRSKEKNAARETDGKAGINDLTIVEVRQDPIDGSTFILGEQKYIRTEMYGTSTKTIYYYTDMVATKIDKNGKLLWMIKIPKTQLGFKGRGGMGVKYIKGNGTHYLIFVDTKKNAALIDKNVVPEKYVDGSDAYLYAYKINDADGKYERVTILNLENVNGIEAYQFSTSRIFDISSKIFMLEIYMKGKEDTMIKMQLKK